MFHQKDEPSQKRWLLTSRALVFPPTVVLLLLTACCEGSVSSPEITISKSSTGVVLHCGSAGWYPEPEVLWLDGEGNLLSAGPPETVRGPDDLYTVSSTVTVEKRPSSSFTCRVHQKTSNQYRETPITVAGDDNSAAFSLSCSNFNILLVVCFLVGMVAVVLIVFFHGWRIKEEIKKQIKQLEDTLKKQNNEPKVDQGIQVVEQPKMKLDPMKTPLMQNNTELEEMRARIQTGLDDVKKEKEKLEKIKTVTLDERQNLLDNLMKWENMEKHFDNLKLKTDHLLSQ